MYCDRVLSSRHVDDRGWLLEEARVADEIINAECGAHDDELEGLYLGWPCL